MTEAARKEYGDYILPRKEGETDDEFRRRTTLIWIIAEEEYALYGQFYQFKHIIRDDRPSTVVVRKADDSTLDQQYCNPVLLSAETKEISPAVEPNQTLDDLENFLDVDASALRLN